VPRRRGIHPPEQTAARGRDVAVLMVEKLGVERFFPKPLILKFFYP
jgi:hypothetical protein